MVSPIVSSSADFSIFNSGWNGTSELAVSTHRAGKFSPSFELRSTGGDISLVRSGFDDIELNPTSDALAIIGPTKAFSYDEGTSVGEFVRGGGSLLIADDFGSSNELLEAMGASSRFSGRLVIDLSFDKSPEFPICFDIVPDALTANVSALQLNYASTLVLGGSAEPLAYTSVASWLDADGDRRQEHGEPKGPFVILAREPLDSGEIILLSDPSVLTNGMREHLDNEMLSSNLVTVLTEGGLGLYIDESHRDYFDPVTVSMEITGVVSGNVKMALFTAAFILALWVATDVVDRAWIWARGEASRAYLVSISKLRQRGAKALAHEEASVEGIVRELSASHPDWRDGTIRYVLKEKLRHDVHVERHK
ncbi:MAG: DUF4350 domain-containing protein [Methanobacteriota archaeon]|nr:MAG: DUF4350 domain-containing protein [Euryarchaeota archaeon]